MGILFGISNASVSVTAPRTWAPVVAGVAALGAFTVVENRSQFPASPVGLFRNPVFLAATFAGLAWNGAQSVAVPQLSNLWQYIEHYDPRSERRRTAVQHPSRSAVQVEIED